MLPRSSRKLTISRIVATAFACWVRPIAQQTIDRFGGDDVVGELLDLRPGQPAEPLDVGPVQGAPAGGGRLEPVGVCIDEVVVEDGRRGAARRPRSSSALLTPANSARSPLTRTGRKRSASLVPVPGKAAGLLRVLEPQQPGLGQRVDRDDLRAALLRLLQGGEHPRVVGARVLPDDDDQVGVLGDVLQGDRALADADRLGQRGAAGLVAHVRAVGQVVGAEPAGEQLVDERGLVAGPAAGVEDGAVRVGRAPAAGRRSGAARRPSRSARSGWRPGARYIGSVSRPLASSQWSVCSRRSATECAAKNAASTRLRVASQATALAPFSQNSACLRSRRGRVAPGAGRAVEAVGLVDPQQRPHRAGRAHLASA